MTSRYVLMVSSLVGAFCVIGCRSVDGGVQKGPYPDYALCESSADCDDPLPECRRLIVPDSGMEVSICTRDCSLDLECPNAGTSGFPSWGFCIGIHEDGQLDADHFEDRICLPEGHCTVEGEECLMPGEDARPGRCVRYDEDPPDVTHPSIVCLDAPPFYNRCESDADCSPESPNCRTLDLDDTVDPVSVCVRTCASENDSTCRFIPTDPAGYRGRCLGINEQGKPDPDADEILCLPGCPFLEASDILRCYIGSGISGTRGGSCGFVEYEAGFDPVPVCVEGKEEEP